MKTLVIQSYRTESVPSWIAVSMRSVRDWAHLRGHEYEFLGDEFFSWAPTWVRTQYANHFFPITDIARLFVLQDAIQRGYEQVIWLDADVLVFDAGRLDFNVQSGAGFCREHVLTGLADGSVRISPPGVNNAAMAFHAGNPVLPFYIYACETLLHHANGGHLERTSLGPALLQRLAAVMPLECTNQVGLFTPLLMQELAEGKERMAKLYAQQATVPLAAANLCHFARHHADMATRRSIDAIYDRAIDLLLGSRGSIINQHRLQVGTASS